MILIERTTPSCLASCRASTTSLRSEQEVDGRDQPGHDEWMTSRLDELVLRLRLEVGRVVTLVQLVGRIAGYAVDHAAALDRGARQYLVGPAQHVFIFMRAQKRR